MVFDAAEQVPGIGELVEIGRGGFAVVYCGKDLDLDRLVAVKVLGIRPDEGKQASFEHEARTMSKLSNHPNIVTIHRIGSTLGGYPFIVMEYAANGSLETALKTRKLLPWQEVCEIGIKVCDAIAVTHSAGIEHRDIKPANLLLSDYQQPLLSDFGIARLTSDRTSISQSRAFSLVHASPEQVSGQRIDQRTDIYSLASTMYELIAGRAAFVSPEDESTVAPLYRIMNEEPPPLDHGNPEAMRTLVATAMAKDPSTRPQSADDFQQELVQIARSQESSDAEKRHPTKVVGPPDRQPSVSNERSPENRQPIESAKAKHLSLGVGLGIAA